MFNTEFTRRFVMRELERAEVVMVAGGSTLTMLGPYIPLDVLLAGVFTVELGFIHSPSS
jgi:hypothetical protein